MTRRYYVQDQYGKKQVEVHQRADRHVPWLDTPRVPLYILFMEAIVGLTGYLVVTVARLLIASFTTHPKLSVSVLILAAIVVGVEYEVIHAIM
jgi:hypothetical protein